jgi:uncharacterized repeat protein (TIGR01451 family)
MRVWLTALVVVLGGWLAAAARAEYVPGATYTGPLSNGRTVTFTVSPDGAYVTSFSADYLYVNCAWLTGTWNDLALITNDSFQHTADGDGDITFSGTFTGLQSASGTIVWVNSEFLCGTPPTETWQATTSSPPLADLGVALTASPEPVLVGDQLTYSATVADAGPMRAPDATLRETLPAGVSFVSATASQGSCAQAEGVVTCGLGAIAKGANATATVVVTPTQAGALAASAAVSGTRQDPTQSNDSASAQTTVQAPCVVPKVKGKPLAAAKRALALASCTTGKVTRKYSTKVKKGRVLSQAPAPGTRLGHLAPVNLVVSRGRRPAKR